MAYIAFVIVYFQLVICETNEPEDIISGRPFLQMERRDGMRLGSQDSISPTRGAPTPQRTSRGIASRSPLANLVVSIAKIPDNGTRLISFCRGVTLAIGCDAQCANPIVGYSYLIHAFLTRPSRDLFFCPSCESVGRYVMCDPERICYYPDVVSQQEIQYRFQNAICFLLLSIFRVCPEISNFWLSVRTTTFRVLPRRILQIKIAKAAAKIPHSMISNMASANIPHICLRSVMENRETPDRAMKYRLQYPSWRRKHSIWRTSIPSAVTNVLRSAIIAINSQ